MAELIVYGAGGHGKVVIDAASQGEPYRVTGVIDDNTDLKGTLVLGRRVLGGLQALLALGREPAVILAVGDNQERARIAEQLDGAGFSYATVLHPTATVAAGVEIGEGTVLFANAVLNPGVRVGNHVIVNTAATVDHDATLGDFVSLGPGVHLSGGVTIESGVALGAGVIAVPDVLIGARSIIGAGAVVTKDIPPGIVAAGVPAREIRVLA